MTAMWECPDFFPVAAAGSEDALDLSSSGDAVKHVLKSSLPFLWNNYYTIGTYDAGTDRYVPDDPAGDYNRTRYDYGTFYASKTFYDPAKQRRVLWGWVNESDTAAADAAKGWAGIQAIPRKVWLDPGGKQLVQWPVEEVESLRGKPTTVRDKVVKHGKHFEIEMYEASQVRWIINSIITTLASASHRICELHLQDD
jgi:beta-fructofuranosidase